MYGSWRATGVSELHRGKTKPRQVRTVHRARRRRTPACGIKIKMTPRRMLLPGESLNSQTTKSPLKTTTILPPENPQPRKKKNMSATPSQPARPPNASHTVSLKIGIATRYSVSAPPRRVPGQPIPSSSRRCGSSTPFRKGSRGSQWYKIFDVASREKKHLVPVEVGSSLSVPLQSRRRSASLRVRSSYWMLMA